MTDLRHCFYNGKQVVIHILVFLLARKKCNVYETKGGKRRLVGEKLVVLINFKEDFILQKRWKKCLCAAMAATMAAGLIAGCGGEKKAANSNEIRIGGNFELTGNVANYGNSAMNGIKLAFKEANAKGGINGKQVNLIIADNKSEPSEANNAMTKLITKDKVVAIMGPITSSNLIATAQIAADKKIPVLTPTGTSPKITVDNGKVREMIFRSCFIDPFQGEVMARFAANSMKVKTAAIYIDNSSDYSKGLAETFRAEFEKMGGKIVAEEAFLQKDTDFKSAITKIKAANPEVIFVPAYYQEVGMIVKQAREMGVTIPLIGTDGWDSPKLVEIAGAAALNNTFFSNHYAADDKDPRLQAFADAYQKEYNQAPDAFAVLGYDGGLMMLDALRRSGGEDPKKIQEALASTKDLQVSSGILTLDAKHNPMKSAVVIEMKEGKQTFKEKVNP